MNRSGAKLWMLVAFLLPTAMSGFAAGPVDSLAGAAHSRLVITTDLDSALVFVDGVFCGHTPLTIDTLAGGHHAVVACSPTPTSWFSRSDSVTITLEPGETRKVRLSVLLPMKGGQFPNGGLPLVIGRPTGSSGRTIALWTSGALTVVAGTIAAYCKISADDKNDAYVATGDAALLDQRRRLDLQAGIAFAATQVAFLVLSYLLLDE
jgi:hypothetical protein